MNVSQRLTVIIDKRTQEANGIVTLDLVAKDDGTLPDFRAGAHIDVYIREGVTQQYLLCHRGINGDRYVIAVLLEPESRGGSRTMHALKTGDELSISEPRNHFSLVDSAANYLLIAGGIGIMPILYMAEELSAVGRAFQLHYCARLAECTAFRQHIEASAFAANVTFHYSGANGEGRLDIAATLAQAPPGTHLYVCASNIFMGHVIETARQLGWSDERIHYEYFAADLELGGDDAAFTVHLARSNQTIHVASDQTVADALINAGIEIPMSCEQGVCGTCLTTVLDGVPDHRDMYMTPDEQARNDRFTPVVRAQRDRCLF